GVVLEVKVKQGDQLAADDLLLVIGTDVSKPLTAATPIAQPIAAPVSVAAPVPPSSAGATEVRAPMPGLVLRIDVKVGDKVQENGLLMIMEAMKMENEIFAPAGGTITSISVKQGDQLMADDLLITIG
ncbi:MAG: biotin/lipoyl-containing protein, partial [Sphaerochaetaceae bacterium]